MGEGSFALRCAELALSSASTGEAVIFVSPDGSLAALAARHGVAHGTSREDLAETLKREPVDRLFSLNNPFILTPDILDQIREIAINYHDSPLPSYAGIHATTWALLAGETTHGITFHELVPAVDAGPILLQRPIPVAADERTCTLNAKCFAVGLETFGELLQRLEEGTLEPRPQQGRRSYFGRAHRPPSGGWLDPRRSAEDNERLVRALDHGPTPNPVGAARLLDDDRVFVVRTASREGEEGQALAMADGPLFPRALEHLDGRVAEPSELSGEWPPPVAALDRLIALDERWAPHERFWVRRLEGSMFRHPMATAVQAGKAASLAAPELGAALTALAETLDAPAEVAGTLVMATYAARLGNAERGGRAIGLRGPGQREAMGIAYAPTVPLRPLADLGQSPRTLVGALQRELDRVEKRGSVALDAMRRWKARPMAIPRNAVDVRWVPSPEGDRSAELTLDLQTPEAPVLRSRGACTPETLERIAAHLTELARSMSEAPDAPAERLSLVPPEERATVESCRGPSVPLGETLVPTQIMETLGAAAGVAISDEERSIAPSDARETVDAAARALRARGVGPGTFVAVACESPAEQVLALLAVMRAGGALVPIDPELPSERARTVLEDASPVLVIGTGGLPFATLRAEGGPGLLQDPAPADPAYAIFTSGSTGRPKGVRVSHGNLAAQLNARLVGYPDRPERLATFHSLAFDSAFAGIFWALAAGAELMVCRDETRREPDAIRTLIRERRPTHIDVPPSAWAEVLAASDAKELESLRAVIVGGEACPPELARLHHERVPGATLHNEYGPTETTIYSTVHRVDPPIDGPIPIGRPIANAHCLVAEPTGEPLPLDVPGELWIGGPGVALGYVDRPDMEAERFVEREGERFYRTGDRVHLGRDGLLHISGRLDQQVQIRGHRVELDEVEVALTELPEVARAVVSARKRKGTTEVVAHIVPAAGASVSMPAIRSALSDRLPAPMIPTAVGTIDTIPLTPAGKLDRASLPSVAPVRTGTAKAETPTEVFVAEIVADELDVPRVGAEDDLFDLGVSSLMAMRIVRRINERVPGARLRVVDVYRFHDIRRLAARVDDPNPTVDAPGERYLIPIQPGDRRLTPLFGVHVLGEGASLYRPLARALGPERPVYGLASPVPAGEQGDHPTDVEELAEIYLQALFSRQPEGPYCLAAVSLASVVAWEMARRLRAEGHEVDVLALFDSDGPVPPPRDLRARIAEHVRRFRERGLEHVVSRVERRIQHVRDAWQDLRVEVARRIGDVPSELRVGLVMRQNVEGALTYTLEPMDVNLTVFHATEDAFYPPGYKEGGLGWSDHARSVDVVDVHGSHLGILEAPAVDTVADALRRRLEALD